jgi:hypothetical protein
MTSASCVGERVVEWETVGPALRGREDRKEPTAEIRFSRTRQVDVTVFRRSPVEKAASAAAFRQVQVEQGVVVSVEDDCTLNLLI